MLDDTLRLLNATDVVPSRITSASGGAYLAFALHCLMIDNGFVCMGGGSRRNNKAKFTPPDGWDKQYNDEEWLFEYRRKDLSNLIVLHLSLQKESKRLFVQGKELLSTGNGTGGLPNSPQGSHRGGAGGTGSFFKDRPFKTHNLGLQLSNYVQNPHAARTADTWDQKVFTNLDRCRSMFMDHVLVPLITEAQKKPPREKTFWEQVGENLFGSEDQAQDAYDTAVKWLTDPRVFLPTAGITVAVSSVVAYKVMVARSNSSK